MKTIYLTGQNNFGNRGCEALVRSTVALLTASLGPVRVLVPSRDPARDAAQWTDAASNGVEFVPAPTVPAVFVQWNRLCRRLPFLLRMDWPAFRPDSALRETLSTCDAVLSIGGDNYSLDYDLASLFFFKGIADYALDMGKTVVLWGASVGPFDRIPAVERQLLAHLRRVSLITLRESASMRYLAERGVTKNVAPVADSAFALAPQPLANLDFWPAPGDKVLALNVSPLIEKLRASGEATTTVLEEVTQFVRAVLETTDASLLLLPHVVPLDGAPVNNDALYLAKVVAALGGESARLRVVPDGLNAAQLKYVISRCRWLIAARTHATIAGFSSAVPTVSIAYSVKAKGINQDLFGHTRYVLETPSVSALTLMQAFATLRDEEADIRVHYAEHLDAYKVRAAEGARWLARRFERVGA